MNIKAMIEHVLKELDDLYAKLPNVAPERSTVIENRISALEDRLMELKRMEYAERED